jgi:hypothetical protein
LSIQILEKNETKFLFDFQIVGFQSQAKTLKLHRQVTHTIQAAALRSAAGAIALADSPTG